jgi:hypothetical protein
MFLVAGIFACGSGGDGGASGALGDTKYLAENIIFSDGSSLASKATIKKNKRAINFEFIPAAYAQSSAIDTETQIYAENVIFESSSSSQIESDNVQDALEEISLTLSSVIVGTWTIQNHHQESYHDSTGKVVINNDGTFDLVEGSFAAIGMGSSGTCSHTEDDQTYSIYTEELMSFSHVNPEGSENSALPTLVKLREDQIVFVGAGGCGYAGRDRVSVLTRVE